MAAPFVSQGHETDGQTDEWTDERTPASLNATTWFLFILFLRSRNARIRGQSLTTFTAYDVFSHKGVPFWVSSKLISTLGSTLKTFWGREEAFSSLTRKILYLAYYQSYSTDSNQILQLVTKTNKYSAWMVQSGVKEIQDGGWPPYWKIKNGHISATVWLFGTQLGTMTFIGRV